MLIDKNSNTDNIIQAGNMVLYDITIENIYISYYPSFLRDSLYGTFQNADSIINKSVCISIDKL